MSDENESAAGEPSINEPPPAAEISPRHERFAALIDEFVHRAINGGGVSLDHATYNRILSEKDELKSQITSILQEG